MAQITLQFADPLNVSVQVGDTAYFATVQNNQSGSNHPAASVDTKPKRLGIITFINYVNFIIIIEVEPGLTPPSSFANIIVMFSKHQLANTSGITGYFAEAEYRNYSTLPAEIFATAVDYVESSK